MNIGIIGCGAIAKMRHAPAVAAHPKATLYAVCDPVREHADALAREYGARAVYDLEALFRDDNVDAVIVCTPERFHRDHVVAALKAGKDVLCEKPLAMNTREGKEIIAAWKESNSRLMVAFSQRMYEHHRLARKLLKEGIIGTPISFRTMLAHRGVEYATIQKPGPDFYDRQLPSIGDVMLNVGCHRVDLVSYLFDSPIHEVYASTPTIHKTYRDGRPIEAADHAMITAWLENGLSGIIWISWCAYGAPERDTIIYGSEGSMHIYEQPGIVVRTCDGEEKKYEIPQEPREGQRITCNFIDMLNGDDNAICDGDDGWRCLQAMEAVRQSDEEGRKVAIIY